MKLLLDQNLSRRMLDQLLPEYPDSSQVALLRMDKSTDIEIWNYAEENNYISRANTENITGDSRPEIRGICVYEVNSESHFGLAL